MRFEEVLPALREGKKVRRAAWNKHSYYCLSIDDLDNGTELRVLLEDDWEIVREPKRVADYLVPDFTSRWVSATGRWVRPSNPDKYFRQTHEVDKQPKGSVMVPGTERDEQV